MPIATTISNPGRLGLCHEQRAIWWRSRRDQTDPSLHLVFAIPCADTKPEHIQAAITALMCRHARLRAVVAPASDPQQTALQIKPRLRIAVPEVVAPIEQEAVLKRQIRRWSDHPFDLQTVVPIAWLLVRRSEADGRCKRDLIGVVHHIASDLLGIEVIFRDLQAILAGQTLPPPSNPEVLVQREAAAMAGPRRAAVEDWWFQSTTAVPAPITLPLVPSVGSPLSSGVHRSWTLSASQLAVLDSLCSHLKATRFSVLLALYIMLLERTTGRRDMLITVPVANRRGAAETALVSHCSNPLPLLCRVDPQATFAVLVASIARQIRQAVPRGWLPGDLIAQQLRPDDPAACFQLAFAWESFRRDKHLLGTMYLREQRGAPSALTMMPFDMGDTVGISWQAPANRCQVACLTALQNSLLHLLDQVDSHPTRPLNCCVLRPPSHSPAPESRRPHDLLPIIQGTARRCPDAILVEDARVQLTAELCIDQAVRLAEDLRQNGIHMEDRVGISMPAEAARPIVQLAVWWAGAVAVPLDPAHPPQRRAQIAADCDCRCIIQSHTPLQRSNHSPVKQRTMPRGRSAYILFTSGSTGRPKGAAISHEALAAFCALHDRAPVKWHDRIVQVAPYSFDMAQYETTWALRVGARLVVCDPLAVDLSTALRRHTITAAILPPSRLRSLGAPWPELTTIVSGGEACTPELAARWSAHAHFVNAYGPTEAGIASHASQLTSDDRRTPIGPPAPAVIDRIVSPALVAVPEGLRGELLIGGIQVGRGYHGQSGLTAAHFIPLPDACGGARAYRTGDELWVGRNGHRHYVGRFDHQLKLRGMRIEAGEIEAALRTHCGVREAVVELRDSQLIAWVVGAADPKKMQADISRHLPRTHVPRILLRDSLPLSIHGKIDRRALAALPLEQANNDQHPPRPGLETQLAVLWTDILGSPPTRECDFFRAGGHSLHAIQLAMRVERELGRTLPVEAVFAHAGFAAIAAAIDGSARAIPLQRLPRTERRPLAPHQLPLWIHHRRAPRSPAYHIPGVLTGRGQLDLRRLCRALIRVTARHEELRLRVDPTGQRLVAEQGLPFTVIDLPAEATEQTLRHCAVGPFDLMRGPLWRAILLRLPDSSWHLALVVHHLIADGWSFAVLAHELTAALHGEDSEERQQLDYLDAITAPPPADSAAVAWWQDYLRDAPRNALWQAAPDHRPVNDGQLVTRLSASRMQSLDALLPEGSRFAVLATLAALVSGRDHDQDDLVLGFPAAGRDHPATEHMVGHFVRTLPLRLRLKPAESLRTLINRVHTTTRDCLAHQTTPLSDIMRSINWNDADGPLIRTLIAYQNQPPMRWRVDGAKLEAKEIPTGTAKYDLALIWDPQEDGSLRCTWSYNGKLFDRSRIRALADRFTQFAEAVATQADRPVRALPPPIHPAPVIAAPPSTPDRRPTAARFAAWARRQGDAVALSSEGMQLSYATLILDAQAEAQDLHKRGYIAGDTVAIDRGSGTDFMVSVAACLHAGLAFQPLDPSQPATARKMALAATEPRAVLRGACQHSASSNVVRLPAKIVHPSLPAYLITTSGSTGTPKPVIVSHRGLGNLIDDQGQTFAITARSRVAQVAALGFDAMIAELLTSLANGATLIVTESERPLPGFDLTCYLARHRCTHLTLTPAALALMPLPPPTSLRFVVTAGEACPPELFARWQAHCDMRNAYGPTEASVCATMWIPDRPVQAALPLGRPINGLGLRVVDRCLLPATTGELLLAGSALADAYRHHHGLTAASFIPDLAGHAGARAYRTGDGITRDRDGALIFVGRHDGQFKRRGFRCERGDIERALLGHPTIDQAMVGLVSGPQHEAQLVAACATSDGKLDPVTVRRALQEQLPPPAIPDRIILVPNLPLSPHGKIDRSALPRLYTAANQQDQRASQQANDDPLAAAITAAWTAVLGQPPANPMANFFTSGGHSLAAVRFADDLGRRLRRPVPVSSIFSHPTHGALQDHLRAPQSTSIPATAPSQPRARRLTNRRRSAK